MRLSAVLSFALQVSRCLSSFSIASASSHLSLRSSHRLLESCFHICVSSLQVFLSSTVQIQSTLITYSTVIDSLSQDYHSSPLKEQLSSYTAQFQHRTLSSSPNGVRTIVWFVTPWSLFTDWWWPGVALIIDICVRIGVLPHDISAWLFLSTAGSDW